MQIGDTHTSKTIVTDDKTAICAGSGDLPVFATPQMIALMENAAMLCVSQTLPEGSTTVGGHMDCSHISPTGVGKEVEATATLTSIEGRKLTFHVEAHDDHGLIGEGTHLRFIVDREKFMGKL